MTMMVVAVVMVGGRDQDLDGNGFLPCGVVLLVPIPP